MTVVYGKPNRAYQLGPKLAEGGEGKIYLVEGHPQLLAKVYLPNRLPQEDKLGWMVANPPVDPTYGSQHHISIAWPRSLLYDASNRFCGFLMPYVHDTIPLLRVFNPKLRAKWAPDFDWRYLHRTARNLASALSAVHAKDYVVGDMNDRNVVVNKSALVTILDVDSFQVIVTTGGVRRTYPCLVGQSEYTPGELQGVAFATRARGPEHDAFAMAVLFFQLLMNGNHPFKAMWTDMASEPPPMEERIIGGLFPYQTPALPNIAPPKNAPSFDILHPDVAHLFKRCFVDGHQDSSRRPNADAWTAALETAERALVDCTQGHVYSAHQRACPWCAQASLIAKRGAQVPLPAAKRMASALPTSRPAPQVVTKLTPQVASTPKPAVVPPVIPSQTASIMQSAHRPLFNPLTPTPPEPPKSRGRPVVLTLLGTVVAAVVLFATFFNGGGNSVPLKLGITLTCNENPELTRIENLGSQEIEVVSIRSLYDTKSYEPIIVNRRLGAGRTVIFRSGNGATSGTVLTTSFIYTNKVYDLDGAQIVTSAGTVTERCPESPRKPNS